jgi:U3 small nucleolar RNA-associated protein 19
LTRKLRSAPALAPLPARQPIGDSFFPSSIIYPAPITADAVTTIKKKSKILLDNMGEEIGLVEEDEEDEASDRGPVDIVSRLWRF